MLDGYESDYVASDKMSTILEMSKKLYNKEVRTAIAADPQMESARPSYLRKHEMNTRLSALESEIKEIDEQIANLQTVRQVLLQEKQEIVRQNETMSEAQSDGSSTVVGKGKSRATNAIDYTTVFDWDPQLKRTMKDVFGISKFRLCQQGVCNANVDGRDIVCVMPTGGGKSLTYQLPALLMPGCTLVISPLISLITDQILHLNEAGVDAVMLTGGTSKGRVKEIQERLTTMAASRGGAHQREIKLCYVTPEKIAKSKGFMSLLRKLVEKGKLARIVIDEAHCVSQLGHDFRPDYKKLGILRQLFPHVPILGLSATCPPKVLKDILKILHMKPVVDGKAASREGTVYFSAPLYRKNLHYAVVPKPSSAKEMFSLMSEYILQKHKNDSGIIYCLSKKDAETVATSLREESKGQIRTGVYHADIPDARKEDLHRRWREGAVKVVCATIAFGLGIDKGNVRFVLHHTISKSLDGYYQESGRAGRDGADADCILYYRPQDVTRQSSITYSDTEGQAKLHDMLRFAQDMRECRKILFAKYFSASSDLSMASWTTEESGAMDKCGHCDNCTRPENMAIEKDVTLEAWQILKILQAIGAEGGRQTIAGLCMLARGGAGGSFNAESGNKRKKSKEKVQLDYDAVADGKVYLPKDDVETLIVHLLVLKFVKEAFSITSYSTNVYVVPGEHAIRLTRFARADIIAGRGPRIHCCFRRTVRKRRQSQSGGGTSGGRKKTGKEGQRQEGMEVITGLPTTTKAGPSRLPLMTRVQENTLVRRKRPHEYVEASEEDEIEDEIYYEDEVDGAIDGDDSGAEDFTHEMRMVNEVPSEAESSMDDDGDGDTWRGDEDGEWEYSLRPSAGTSKKKWGVGGRSRDPPSAQAKMDLDGEVISLSSD